MLTIMDVSALVNGLAKAAVFGAKADDLRLLDTWKLLADTPPPLSVRAVCQYSREVFEVDGSIHIRDMLGNAATATVTSITLLTPSVLTVTQLKSLGYAGQILMPAFDGNRIWFVELRDVRSSA